MFTDITAAVAAAALVAIMVGIGTLLYRASRWPDFTEPPKHALAAHPDGTRPRPWDEVTSEAATLPPMPLPGPMIPPLPEPAPVPTEPIDALDPRWDWRAYADALDEELVAA